ncbi:hypothetical protein BJ138DRAFT_1155777 [Hygrophoropsis aurantiaca]|uniref:Uncharacterized protein n=1 Tax=Hygrophoropsis aurantiaca TaxID=72124 RepID=A0ACB8A757_9AGAM|nr:hypothetical protein BJ138DRAFT_1155777 [Hygrophoropsis aurantiaca]
MESNTPRVSFIAIVDFSEDARWLFLTESASDLLGFEPRELIGRPALELVHPDEFPQVRQMHYDTIRQDKAAVLAYLRLKHKDPFKGYILCAVSRTVVHNVLVGSVSFAAPGAKAMHNASTAQEVEVVTPTARDFELRRWGDPSPMPPSPVPPIPSPVLPSALTSSESQRTQDGAHLQKPSSPAPAISFKPLPSQSSRSALILDRFSIHCTVIYCSNDLLLSTTSIMGRSFYDFVTKRSEDTVRSWIDIIKAWGVNERGQPSDGGFGFGKFSLCTAGRDSSERSPALPPARRRDKTISRNSSSRPQSAHTVSSSSSRSRFRTSPTTTLEEEIAVDAIFSAHSDGILVILRTTS